MNSSIKNKTLRQNTNTPVRPPKNPAALTRVESQDEASQQEGSIERQISDKIGEESPTLGNNSNAVQEAAAKNLTI